MSNRHYIQSKQDLDDVIAMLRDKKLGEYGFLVEVKTGVRTTKQNNAMHLYFTMLAEALDAAGLDIRRLLKPEIDIPWTPALVKEHLWRPIMKVVTGKDSTTQLDRGEVGEVYEILNRHLGQKHGVMVAFPDRFR